MAITSTESFLALLEKSQLLGAKDLEKVQGAAAKYGDAKALARALVAAKGLTRWQAGQLLAGRSSFTLGKYQLIELLGRGGMGSVFAAEQKSMGRRVALKIISKQTGRDPEQLECFLEEARRIAGLDHPNIVRAFDVDHEGERYFLVLEYVEGRDLQQIVESDGPLDVRRAVSFTRQTALGLAHAHDRKMIHCDIKPANLIVGDDDSVKILDMGMARLMESDGSSSDSNENIVGTIDYIAPEQALAAEDLDHRVDIYSLGCTLYFLLTSRPPFGEGTLAQRIMKHQMQDPRPISETRSGVPSELADVCLKMMAKQPSDRFQTAMDVAQSLERWAQPVTSRDASRRESGPPVVELIDDDDHSSDQGDGEVSISVVDSGSFSVRSGSSRGRRPAAVKKAVREVSASEESPGFFADPRKKWATIVLAGLLLLGGAAGGFAWMGSGGDTAPGDGARDTVASAEALPPSKPVLSATDGGLALDSDLADLEGAFGGLEKSSGKEEQADEMQASAPASDNESAKLAETVTKPVAEDSTDPKKEAPKSQEANDGAKPAAEKEKKEPEKKEPEKKAPKVAPFKDFPTAVSIPVLSDKDAFGEASKSPQVLGKVHGPVDVNWQMLLVGGDKILKGGRKFVLTRTVPEASKAAWSIQLSGSGSGNSQENIARLWRDGEALAFQWAEEAPGATANYLRNCILQVRVAGESRYTALTEPIHAEPIGLDLLRGQSRGSVNIKWAPDDTLLRFKFSKIDGFENAVFEPSEPVGPKTPVALNFVYTDRHENDTNAVTFQILPTSRASSLNVDLRMVNPTSRWFQSIVGNANEQQLGVGLDRKGTERSDLKKRLDKAKREDAHKLGQDYDTLDRQYWILKFFLDAHKKAFLHYQVVADVGGQELVLVSTN